MELGTARLAGIHLRPEGFGGTGAAVSPWLGRVQLNERQVKVIARMFRQGIDGIKGGLSAENYITIAKASRATATRDLQDLVAKGALTKTGELDTRAII
jgi:Fic family protein